MPFWPRPWCMILKSCFWMNPVPTSIPKHVSTCATSSGNWQIKEKPFLSPPMSSQNLKIYVTKLASCEMEKWWFVVHWKRLPKVRKRKEGLRLKLTNHFPNLRNGSNNIQLFRAFKKSVNQKPVSKLCIPGIVRKWEETRMVFP